MSPASPSWYDLLGVAPDASDTEIRTAWRSGIADLDPTDRRFAVLNQAAEVLLDPRRRAAYDAELTASQPQPVSLRKPREDVGQPVAAASDSGAGPAAGQGRVVPGWLLAGLAVLTVLVAVAAVTVAVRIPSDAAIAEATTAARSAAERAIVPVLSYDAGHLDDSRSAAEQYLTGEYRKKYDDLFDGVIKENAPATGTVVTASVVDSGVVRAEEDRVQVFLLVDQSRTNKQDKQPVVYKNWVTVTMERVDGDWLVANLTT